MCRVIFRRIGWLSFSILEEIELSCIEKQLDSDLKTLEKAGREHGQRWSNIIFKLKILVSK